MIGIHNRAYIHVFRGDCGPLKSRMYGLYTVSWKFFSSKFSFDLEGAMCVIRPYEWRSWDKGDLFAKSRPDRG